MLNYPRFRGIGTAVVTPFEKGNIDYVSFGKILEFQLKNNIDFLVVCGTTGESSTLSAEEKKSIYSFSVKQVRGRVPVIAGTGSNNISEACKLTEAACEAGVNGILAVTPYYNKTTKNGLFLSYKEISDSCDKPIIVYNVPSRTGYNISPEEYEMLCEIENIYGIKEADMSIDKLMRIIEKCGKRLHIFSGNDELLLPYLSLGCDGVISVASNIIPREMKKIYLLFLEGKNKEAYTLQKEIFGLERILFSELNPIPVKTALSFMGFCKKEFRLPLTEMADENELRQAMKRRGLSAE